LPGATAFPPRLEGTESCIPEKPPPELVLAGERLPYSRSLPAVGFLLEPKKARSPAPEYMPEPATLNASPPMPLVLLRVIFGYGTENGSEAFQPFAQPEFPDVQAIRWLVFPPLSNCASAGTVMESCQLPPWLDSVKLSSSRLPHLTSTCGETVVSRTRASNLRMNEVPWREIGSPARPWVRLACSWGEGMVYAVLAD
jgi:hypothetical protein